MADIDHLSEEAKEMFKFHVPENVKTPSQIAILITALEAMDRGSKARGLIDRDGLVIVSKRSGLPRRNPAIPIEQEAKKTMLKGFKMLGLEWRGAHRWGKTA